MAGGILLLSGMLLVLSPVVAIPLHGVVQLASNSTRLLVFREHIHWPIVAAFAPLAAVGSALGVQVVMAVPEAWLKLGIGLFILGATHLPKKPKGSGREVSLAVFAPLGLVAGFLGMLVGATGPFIAPLFLRAKVLKEGLIATKATCQAFVHLFKLFAFGAIGFAYDAHFGLLAVLTVMVVFGTFVGKRLLKLVSERLFVVALKVVLTAVALKLVLVDAIPGLLA